MGKGRTKGGRREAVALLALCVAFGCLSWASAERARANRIAAGMDRPYVYVDNLAPGFSEDLCKDRSGVIQGPYLQSGGPDRMIVRWRGEASERGVVCYGTSPGNMGRVAVDNLDYPKPAGEHIVEVKGLEPETTYYYVVATIASGELPPEMASVAAIREHSPYESYLERERRTEMMRFLWPSEEDNGPSVAASEATTVVPMGEYFSFTTFPESKSKVNTPIRVWAVGDSGTGDDKSRSVRDAFVNFTGGDWDITLGLGDLAYGSGTDSEFHSKFFNYLSEQNARIPVYTTPGNHDADSCDMDAQTGPYFELFSNPGDGKSGGLASNHKSYYSFDYGPIHFVSVDSHRLGLENDPDLYAWLEKDLAAAQEADWIVVFQHQPPYSKGGHDSDAQYECYKLRTNLVPMYEKYGVDLVLAGHSHSHERSHLLQGHYGSSGEIHSNPSVIKQKWSKSSEGIDTLEKDSCGPNSGTLYLVSGSGGKTSGGSLDHPAMQNSQNVLGSVLLEFNPDASLSVLFVDSHGEVLDEAKLSKAWCLAK